MAAWNADNRDVRALAEATAVLVEKRFSSVYYYDICDDGVASFQCDNFDHRDELAWGIDLVCEETSVGFTWVWHNKIHEYGIGVFPGGIHQALTHGANRIDQSSSPRWQPYLSHTIERLVFSKGTRAHESDPVCDCRIEFTNAPPIWICARQANSGCDANGDDCVIVFTEHEAALLGIDTKA